VGYSHGDRIQPLANLYFGGFGNFWVDQGSISRYRRHESFPGAEINQLAGTNFIRNMVELNLPPLRFRRLGMPSVYISWARLALFGAALSTNLDSELYERRVYSVGGQLDFRIVAMSHLRFTLSFGYGTWFEGGENQDDEFMVSLKVL
jgi:hypothetical protein